MTVFMQFDDYVDDDDDDVWCDGRSIGTAMLNKCDLKLNREENKQKLFELLVKNLKTARGFILSNKQQQQQPI